MAKYINSDMFYNNLIDWRFADNLDAFPCDELLDAILKYKKNKETSLDIVRCKDCKFYNKGDGWGTWCQYWDDANNDNFGYINDNDYCSKAKRG